MRLSTERDRDETAAIAVLHAALDAGVTLLDTADAYGWSDEERGHNIEYCPHGAGPPQCWCRKPLPGLGVLLIHRHQLDPAKCLYVGDGSHDAGYARRLGFGYHPASEFLDGGLGQIS
jgi:Aldo/keto reductase family